MSKAVFPHILEELTSSALKHGVGATVVADAHDIDVTRFGSSTKQIVPGLPEVTITLRGAPDVMGTVILHLVQVFEEDDL